MVDYRQLQDPSLLIKALYLLTGLASQAVLVFFVQSGFFVGGAVLRAGSHFDPAKYAASRLTRLWIVLIPALVLTLALDSVVATRAPEVFRGNYYALWHSGPDKSGYSASGWTFLGNLVFLQGIVSPVFGTNGPLWSLAYEFWYYASFPLLAIAAGFAAQQYSRRAQFVCAIIVVIALFVLPNAILEGYVVWMLGVVAYLGSQAILRRRRPAALAAAIALFGSAIALSKSLATPTIGPIPASWLVALAFMPACIVLAAWPVPRSPLLATTIGSLAKGLSEISYSLYLSHFPLLVLITVFAYDISKNAPSASGCLHFLATLGALIGLSGLFWLAFESKTTAVRNLVQKHLFRT